MKKYIKLAHLILFVSIFCLQNLDAQRNADFALHWKYREYPQSKSFAVPGFLVKFASVFVKNKTKRKLVRHIGRTRILLFEDYNPVAEKDVAKAVRRGEVGGLSTLLTVRSDGERVHILGREKRGKIRKLVILAWEEDSFTMVSVKCKLKMEDIGDLISESMQGKKEEKEKADEKELAADSPLSILPVSIKRH